jgi:hypothetical protein
MPSLLRQRPIPNLLVQVTALVALVISPIFLVHGASCRGSFRRAACVEQRLATMRAQTGAERSAVQWLGPREIYACIRTLTPCSLSQHVCVSSSPRQPASPCYRLTFLDLIVLILQVKVMSATGEHLCCSPQSVLWVFNGRAEQRRIILRFPSGNNLGRFKIFRISSSG